MNTPKLSKTMLTEYAELKIEEKEIAERLKELQPKIKEAMRAQDVDKVNTDLGSFTLAEHTTWKYSPARKELEEKEKASGVAKRMVSTVLKFIAIKS